MSERAAMKRRVRGLLHKNWLSPLMALLLAWVPLGILYAVVFLLARPAAVAGMEVQIVWSLQDPMALLLQLLALFSDPAPLLQPLGGWLPFGGILLGLHLFIGMPIAVSVASYFLSFLRGKKPKPTDVYGSFSGKYPRALGGMAYRLLWQVIWLIASFVVPTVLMFISVPVVSAIGIELKYQVYVFIGVMVVCIIWYIAFFFLFINRMLAYCLTPVCIAAQPRLAAYRAVRLSRKLMQGNKWRLLMMFASFLHYFIPAIIALIALGLLGPIASQVTLAAGLEQTLRTILWVIVIANQLAWVYLAPYISSCFHAFYIERKREALLDQEVTQADFSTPVKPWKVKKTDPADADDPDAENE